VQAADIPLDLTMSSDGTEDMFSMDARKPIVDGNSFLKFQNVAHGSYPRTQDWNFSNLNFSSDYVWHATQFPAGLNLSSETTLDISLRGSSNVDGCHIKFKDGSGKAIEIPVSGMSTSWGLLEVPISELTARGIDVTDITEIVLVVKQTDLSSGSSGTLEVSGLYNVSPLDLPLEVENYTGSETSSFYDEAQAPKAYQAGGTLSIAEDDAVLVVGDEGSYAMTYNVSIAGSAVSGYYQFSPTADLSSAAEIVLLVKRSSGATGNFAIQIKDPNGSQPPARFEVEGLSTSTGVVRIPVSLIQAQGVDIRYIQEIGIVLENGKVSSNSGTIYVQGVSSFNIPSGGGRKNIVDTDVKLTDVEKKELVSRLNTYAKPTDEKGQVNGKPLDFRQVEYNENGIIGKYLAEKGITDAYNFSYTDEKGAEVTYVCLPQNLSDKNVALEHEKLEVHWNNELSSLELFGIDVTRVAHVLSWGQQIASERWTDVSQSEFVKRQIEAMTIEQLQDIVFKDRSWHQEMREKYLRPVVGAIGMGNINKFEASVRELARAEIIRKLASNLEIEEVRLKELLDKRSHTELRVALVRVLKADGKIGKSELERIASEADLVLDILSGVDLKKLDPAINKDNLGLIVEILAMYRVTQKMSQGGLSSSLKTQEKRPLFLDNLESELKELGRNKGVAEEKIVRLVKELAEMRGYYYDKGKIKKSFYFVSTVQSIRDLFTVKAGSPVDVALNQVLEYKLRVVEVKESFKVVGRGSTTTFIWQADALYNQLMDYVKSGSGREMQANIAEVVARYLVDKKEIQRLFEDDVKWRQVESGIEMLIGRKPELKAPTLVSSVEIDSDQGMAEALASVTESINSAESRFSVPDTRGVDSMVANTRQALEKSA